MTHTVQHPTTTDRLAAARRELVVDAKSYTDRAAAAVNAGEPAEAARCLKFAADSMALAVRLGVTEAETRAAVAAYTAELQ